MLKHIHHLTFLVRDLDAACRRYTSSFGIGPFIRERLSGRGVETARIKIGDTWLVFAQPTDPDSAPGRHFSAHGEGLYILSFAVEDLDESIATLGTTPMHALPRTRRKGVSNWEVVDLAGEASSGFVEQLSQE